MPRLLGVEEQPDQRFVLAVIQFQADDLVGGNDLREANERAGNTGGTRRNPAVSRLAAAPFGRRHEWTIAVPLMAFGCGRRGPHLKLHDPLRRVRIQFGLDDELALPEQAAGKRISITAFAGTIRLASSAGLACG